MSKLKVIELFGGIGAPRKALTRLGIDFEVVDYVEIDKYAVKSYNAMYNENYDPQDIISWNKDLDVDLIFHGSPCQDFSIAGKGAGADEESGTRSSLMYETIRIVSKLKPKYVIWENVKAVLNKNHKHNFDKYLEKMESLGYTNYYQVLNAKDYGIPQNRERVFTVSILDEIEEHSGFNEVGIEYFSVPFTFPTKQELRIKLKDILEDEVDEKYYLSEDQINKIVKSNFMQEKTRIQEKDYCDTLMARDYKDPKCVKIKQLNNPKHSNDRIYGTDGLSPTLNTMQGGNRQPFIKIKNATKKGYIEATDGDGIDLAYPDSKTRRGRVQEQKSHTITTSDNLGILENYHIRKLTPKECWRLMGFDDSDFYKAQQVNSNTQLYKQAGNSIVVNVLEAIFENLLGGLK